MFFDKLIIYSVAYFGIFMAILFYLYFFENLSRIKNPRLIGRPDVTIVVPVYNRAKYIKKTMDSILNLNYPRDKLQLIIVDDGSTDDSYNIAKGYRKQGVEVYKLEKNSGKGEALNYALARAKSEFFTCLDADSTVDPDALLKMLGYFRNKKVMAVTPSLKVEKPKSILQRMQMIEYLLGVYLRKTFAFMGSIHVTPGPFTIYRKEFFDRFGHYAENNLTEDIECALRIQSNNFIIENVIDAYIYTMGVKKFRPLLKQRLRWYRGFIDNVLAYRHLCSRKYGTLGLVIIPVSFMSVVVTAVMLFYTLFKFSVHVFDWFAQMIAVNFDFIPLLRFDFDAFFLNTTPFAIIGLITLVASVSSIIIARKYSRGDEKILWSYIAFMYTYFVLYPFWWMIAAYYKVANKKIKWGSKLL